VRISAGLLGVLMVPWAVVGICVGAFDWYMIPTLMVGLFASLYCIKGRIGVGRWDRPL